MPEYLDETCTQYAVNKIIEMFGNMCRKKIFVKVV
jgi:hypothetical protein